VGVFKNEDRQICFTLVVNNLGIKYGHRDDIDHLIVVLEDHYDIEIDWRGDLYSGITLDWNYKQCHDDLSMPNYIKKVLEQYQPDPIQYSPKSQLLPKEDPGTLLEQDVEQYIRQVVGSLLYYARVVDLTISFLPSAELLQKKQTPQIKPCNVSNSS